jgi:hypothetical protein
VKTVTTLVLTCALAGCEREAIEVPPSCRSGDALAQRAIDDVAQEAPGQVRNFWRAANEQARTLGGNLAATLEGETLVLAFSEGITVRARSVGACDGDVQIGAETLAEMLGLPRGVRARRYNVAREDVSDSAPMGGLCGDLKTHTLMAAEFVGDDEKWILRLASFQGGPVVNDDVQNLKLCFALDYRL